MAMFGPAHTLFSYMISFAFTDPQTALKFISLVYMIAGFILPFVLKLISFGIDRCEGPVYVGTQLFAQAIPLQPMTHGLIDMLTRGHLGFFREQTDREQEELERMRRRIGRKHGDAAQKIFDDYQKCDGYVTDVSSALVALALGCLLFALAVILFERVKLLHFQTEEAWASMKERATDMDDDSKCLQVRNLKKTYNGKTNAVRGINRDLSASRETMGLLGANGAGKSSTFNMVTMQVRRTSGEIKLLGQDISTMTHFRGINITA